jgi:hypothetical protein
VEITHSALQKGNERNFAAELAAKQDLREMNFATDGPIIVLRFFAGASSPSNRQKAVA